MKKHIPNTITTINLICGCLAISYAFEWNLILAAYLIIIASVCDFLDGMMARLLKVSNPLGEQLDSLSDMVSFGLAPGIILFQFTKFLNTQGDYLLLDNNPWLFYIAFLIPVFSAFRLAKFNIDTRQTDGFIGLATPANANFFIFIVLLYFYPELPQLISTFSILNPIISNPLIMLGIGVVFSFLLVAEVPMFSLKVKSLKWTGNELRFSFLGIFILLLFLVNIAAFPIIIFLYIVWSFINNFSAKKS